MRLLTLLAAILGATSAIANDKPSGTLEGQLKIVSSKEVELAPTENSSSMSSKIDVQNYGEYPLVVLDKNNRKEVTAVTADMNGNYRVALPPGDYVLDVRRGPNGRSFGHARAEPHAFTILPNQTVRVDMDIDTGVR